MADYHDILLVWNAVDSQNIEKYVVVRYSYDPGTGAWDDVNLVGETKKPYITDKKVPESYDPATGGYLYAVWAVDDAGNYSGTPALIWKTSPPEAYTPPDTPTGLVARRRPAYDGVELHWNDNPDIHLKGYVVFRTIDFGTTWDVIGTTAKSNFTDTDYPLGENSIVPERRITYVSYAVAAYDKAGNISSLTAATATVDLPVLQGFKYSIDYLSLAYRWREPLPEDEVGAVIGLLKKAGTTAWAVVGAVNSPTNQIYFDGPLEEGEEYDAALAVQSETHKIHAVDTAWADMPASIYAVSTGSKYFELQPPTLGLYPAKHALRIVGGPNAGYYTITGSTYIGGLPARARVFVAETPPSASTDGYAYTCSAITLNPAEGNLAAKYPAGNLLAIMEAGYNNTIVLIFFTEHTAGGTKLYLKELLPSGDARGFVANTSTAYPQPRVLRVVVPEYASDDVPPCEPALVTFFKDPANDRVFVTWSRLFVDDDFYNYEVWVRQGLYPNTPGVSDRPWVLYDTTRNNNVAINNISTIVDRRVNQINVVQTAYMFTVDGDVSDQYMPGERIEIHREWNRTEINKPYTVVSAVHGGGTPGITTITVVEPITTGAVPFAASEEPIDGSTAHVGKPREVAVRVFAIDRAGNGSIAAEGICEWRDRAFEAPGHSATAGMLDPNPAGMSWGALYTRVSQTVTFESRVDITITELSKLYKYFKNYMLLYGIGPDLQTAFADCDYKGFGVSEIVAQRIVKVSQTNQFYIYASPAMAGDHYVWLWIVDEFGNTYPTNSASKIYP